MSERLRLVLSSHTFLPTVGGAELGVHEIARRLAKRHEVIVLAPGHPAPDSDYAPDDYRLVHVTNVVGDARALRARITEFTGWAYVRALVKLQRTGPPIDAVNCHFIRRSTLLAIVARYVLRTPVILSLVGRSDVVAHLHGTQRARAALALRVADRVIANSTYYLRGSRFATEAHIIPYGVDLRRFTPGRQRQEGRRQLGLNAQDFVILAVQRLEALKRVDLLIRAMVPVVHELPGARLLVVGTGSHEQVLRAQADRLGIGHAVVFTGYVSEDELPSMFGLADVYATHSESETFGVTFAEAMAAGLPIVAADTSCVGDVLDPDNATIVAPGDEHAYSRALLDLARRPGIRALQGTAGRHRAEREFDWQRIADSYEQVILSCLKDPRRRGP